VVRTGVERPYRLWAPFSHTSGARRKSTSPEAMDAAEAMRL
jgi:hypothetical protein